MITRRRALSAALLSIVGPGRPERTYAGTCRQFTLTLADGTTYTALFRFIR